MSDGLRVISLFDGMSCGRIALEQMGVPLESYDCWEIDKYASAVTQHNFPDNVNHGDVFKTDFKEYRGADLLIGGSPCTYWSIAQSSDRRETTASGLGWELFSQYVRALREAEPRMFLYENNKSMSKEIRKSITETFGFEPIHINSALVSAQKRDRLYWVGIRNDDGTYRRADVTQPEDRGILLKDVLDSTVYCLRMVRTEEGKELRKAYESHEIHHGYNEHRRPDVRGDGKSNTITTVTKDNMVIEPVNPLSDSQMEYMLRETTKGRNHFDFGHVFDTTREKSPCVTTGANRVPYNVVVEQVEDDVHLHTFPQNVRVRRHKVDVDGLKALLHSHRPKNISEVADALDTPLTRVEHWFRRDDSGFAIPDPEVWFRLKDMLGIETDEFDAQITEFDEREGVYDRNNRVYDTEGKYPTMLTSSNPPVMEPVPVMPKRSDGLKTSIQNRVYSPEGKGVAVTSFVQNVVEPASSDSHPVYEVKDGRITFRGKEYPIRLPDGRYRIRKLTVSECKRLQTVPDWYDMTCISNAQAYKCLGNGWTVEVIMHLFRCLGIGVDA